MKRISNKSRCLAPDAGYRIIIAFSILALMLSLTGCAQLRKKFIRKKKVEEAMPHYERIKKYDVSPSIELYTKHYIFWRSWHREAVNLLGKNTKKDKRCVREMIKNLEDMRDLLVDEKGDQLEDHILVLRKIERDLQKRSLTFATKTRVRMVLEKEFKLIKINFSYTKMEPYIRSDFKKSAS